MGWGSVVCSFACRVIRDCDSYRKLERDFGVSDSPMKQDYVLFLRFESVGNKDGYLQTLSDGTTAVTSMLLEMYIHDENVYFGGVFKF